jgi:hypothetical protein
LIRKDKSRKFIVLYIHTRSLNLTHAQYEPIIGFSAVQVEEERGKTLAQKIC